MNIYIALTSFLLTGLPAVNMAQQNPLADKSGIIATPGATHIARINSDTVVVITGSTYSFTVDTPEDQGLVSTNPGIVTLLREIRSKNGHTQQYSITDRNGTIKTGGPIVSGDRLVVATEDGKQPQKYYLRLQTGALNGRLDLERSSITLNSPTRLVLRYTAGQRSPDVSVSITVPAGIEVTMENTTVNVIGRGHVLLKDLATQSIGRVGSNYSYSKVGAVALTRLANGSTAIQFSHLDLRPANGSDLELRINDVLVSKAGAYRFQGTYTTSSPEVLTSVGGVTETAFLNTSNLITDFARIADKKQSYQEAAAAITSLQFTWTTSLAPTSRFN
ncbi:hypothetical protein [Paraflavitalea speifideaquila]|uniref:hypothetical protein n=1 Tax=Paraflavitalea speifideaquila TaxID=3076558 RepID=UPI0028EC9835|nr:hypothetical protein [Paraflavitalea speifideiaquila]